VILYSDRLAWNCLFTPILEKFWRIVSPKWIPILSQPPKKTVLGENTSYEPPVRPGCVPEIKSSINQLTKSHKTVTFHLNEKKPRWMDWNVHSSCRSRGHSWASSSNLKNFGILMSWGSKFALFHWLCTLALQQCRATGMWFTMHMCTVPHYP